MERDPFDLVGEVLDGQFRIGAVAGLSEWSVLYRGRALAGDAEVAVQCLRLPALARGRPRPRAGRGVPRGRAPSPPARAGQPQRRAERRHRLGAREDGDAHPVLRATVAGGRVAGGRFRAAPERGPAGAQRPRGDDVARAGVRGGGGRAGGQRGPPRAQPTEPVPRRAGRPANAAGARLRRRSRDERAASAAARVRGPGAARRRAGRARALVGRVLARDCDAGAALGPGRGRRAASGPRRAAAADAAGPRNLRAARGGAGPPARGLPVARGTAEQRGRGCGER